MAGQETKQTIRRDRITWIAYSLLAIYGYFLNILGPITPFLHEELGLTYTVSSFHFSAFAIGILVVGLGGNQIIQRTGRQQALSIGAIGIGLGALLLVAGRSPLVTIGASFLMGCVGSLILAVVPVLLSDKHGELRAVALSEANVLASLVSALAALLVGWFSLLVIGWRLALILMAAVSIGLGAWFRQPNKPQASQTKGHYTSSMLPSIYWLLWVAIVLAVSIEFCMVFWSADYVETQLGLLRSRAAQTVSLFLAGMILGRLSASRLLAYFNAQKVVLASILFGFFSFILFWRTNNTLTGLISLTLVGFFVASLYPLLLSLAIGAANSNTVQAGARATLASGTAILVLPLVLGRLADLVDLRGAFAVVAVLFAFLFLVVLFANKILLGIPEVSHENPGF
jgi:fucose permease